MTESVPLNTPLADLELSPDAATYVGMLEGTIATQVIQMNKFRALLELLTGDQWDDVKLDPNGEKLKEISINALVKQTGMSKAQATILVQKRWNDYNEPENKPSLENVSTSAPPAGVQPMSERLAAWRAKQLAAIQDGGDESSSDGTDSAQLKGPKLLGPQSISIDVRE